MHLSIRRTLDPAVEPVSLDDMKNYLRVDIEDDDSLIESLISMARERAEDVTSRGLLSQSWTLTLDRFPVAVGHYFEQGSYRRHHGQNHKHIVLPRGPVLSVDSVSYVDLTGTPQTLDPSLYAVDTQSEPARIAPAPGLCWPVAKWDVLNAVTVKFTVGYEQTVIETLTLPSTAPLDVPVSRPVNSLSLLACIDATSMATVAATMTDGVVSATGGTANEDIVVTYCVSSIPQSLIHAIKLIVGTYYENRAEVVQGGGNFNSLPLSVGITSLLGMYDMFPLGLPKE